MHWYFRPRHFIYNWAYYLDINAALVIGHDAGYWMLDTGLTRYSVDFKIRKGVKAILQQWIARSEITHERFIDK